MTTTKQAQANRRNAKKSTGPKTQGGKLMSSQNAITHGIFSTSPLLPSENAEQFEALKKDVMAVFPPIDIVAVGMVERIVLAMLRQQRLRVAEAAKLQISMTPEIMAEEISDALRVPWNNRLTAKDISEKQEKSYKYWTLILKEFEGVNINAAPSNIAHLAMNAPNVHAQLKDEASNSVVAYDVFMRTPAKIVAALEKIKQHAQDFTQMNEINHTAYGIAQQMKAAKLVPDSANLALLSKYQLQLDNDLYRAIDAYKKHIAWRAEVLEIEVEEVTEEVAEIED